MALVEDGYARKVAAAPAAAAGSGRGSRKYEADDEEDSDSSDDDTAAPAAALSSKGKGKFGLGNSLFSGVKVTEAAPTLAPAATESKKSRKIKLQEDADVASGKAAKRERRLAEEAGILGMSVDALRAKTGGGAAAAGAGKPAKAAAAGAGEGDEMSALKAKLARSAPVVKAHAASEYFRK